MAIISSACCKARRRLYSPVDDQRGDHSNDDRRLLSSASDDDDDDGDDDEEEDAGNILANIDSDPGRIKQEQQQVKLKLHQAEYVAALGHSIGKINRELAHRSAAQRASHIRRAMDTCMITMPPASLPYPPYPSSSPDSSSMLLPQTMSMASHSFAQDDPLHQLQYDRRRRRQHTHGHDHHHRHHHHPHPHHRCRYVKILRRHRQPSTTMMTRLGRSSSAAAAPCRPPNSVHNSNYLPSSSTTLMMQQQQLYALNRINRSQMRSIVGHSSNYTATPNSDPALPVLTTVNHPSHDHQLLQLANRAADPGQTIIDQRPTSNVIGSINIDNNQDIISRDLPPPDHHHRHRRRCRLRRHHMRMPLNATGNIDDIVDGDHQWSNTFIPTQEELRKLQSALRFPDKYNHVVISNLGNLDDRPMLDLHLQYNCPWRQRSNISSSAAAASSAGHMRDIFDPDPDSASDSDLDSEVLDPVMLLGQAAQHILALQFQVDALNSVLSLQLAN